MFAALTVGVGATTSVFSLINSLLIAPLPVADSERVARITALGGNNSAAHLSLPDLLDLKQRIHSADAFAFFRDMNGNLGSNSRPMLVHMLEIDSDLFQVLDIKMAQGHAFGSDSNQPGHACEAVISWALWQSRFNSEPMVNRYIRLNEKPCLVTGVLPQSLDIPADADIWTPKTFDLTLAASGRGFRSFYGMAHLKHGVSVAAFNAELNRLSNQLSQENPGTDSGLRLQAVLLRTVVSGDSRQALMIMFAAVSTVLLMACANVANLQLARASARMREISVRVAVGASRSSLIQQMLTESLLLALLSSLSGLALSVLFVRWIRSLPHSTIPRPEAVLVDWRVVLFAILTAGLTGVLFGAVPAFKVSFAASFKNITGILGQSGARVLGNKSQQLARTLLVASESALATTLLVASLLLLRSFEKVSKIDPGFPTDHLLTAYVSMNPARYPYTKDSARFARSVISRLKTKPGIVSATFTTSIPLQGGTSGSGPVQIEGRPPVARSDREKIVTNTGVSPEFRQTLRIPLEAGVDLKQQDDSEEATAVLVNSTFAKTLFPNESALGKRIRYAVNVNASAPWEQIVGIIGDTRQAGPEAAIRPELYRPLARTTNNFLGIVIRTVDNPASHVRDIEAAVNEVDAELPIFYPRTMTEVAWRRLGSRAFMTTLIAGFAFVAWMLACGGTFAVIGYAVSIRSNDIATRMALGASQSAVLRMTMVQAMVPACSGISAGLAAALVLNRYLAGLLYGVERYDLTSYAGAALLLAISSALAAWLPATRASRIEPWQALRAG